MDYRYYFLLIAFLFFSCRKTPECNPEICSDVYYQLSDATDGILSGTQLARPALYYNGVDTIESDQIAITSGYRTFNENICSDICEGETTYYTVYREYKWHFCSHVPHFFYWPPGARTFVELDGAYSNADSTRFKISASDYTHEWVYGEAETTFYEAFAVDISQLGEYYVGDIEIHGIDYYDMYIFPLNGIDIYYSHEIGLFNTYFDPDYILIPEY
jgi:hypothetical protein